MGRTATVYSYDQNGKIYGASSAGYVSSDNAKQNNRIESSAVVGIVPKNLIANGGFEDS